MEKFATWKQQDTKPDACLVIISTDACVNESRDVHPERVSVELFWRKYQRNRGGTTITTDFAELSIKV